MNRDDFESLKSRGWTEQPDGSWSKAGGEIRASVPVAKPERNASNEPVAEEPVQVAPPVRRLVRYTRFGLSPLDDDNLKGGTKWITDTLVLAGILHDDSPQFAQIEVRQVKVDHWWEESTKVEVHE